jgi:hypothetical protein
MSLFGIIPIAEIKELSVKCEKFLTQFIEDKNEKKLENDTNQKNQPDDN